MITLSYKRQNHTLTHHKHNDLPKDDDEGEYQPHTWTGQCLKQEAISAFFPDHSEEDVVNIKLLHKGKLIRDEDEVISSKNNDASNKKVMKIIVMATLSSAVKDVQSRRSDPTIRSFAQEDSRMQERIGSGSRSNRRDAVSVTCWGKRGSDMSIQDKNYKFCKFEACTWQSFGHRSSDETPHAFRALEILHKLAADPGVKAVMMSRELVVGTLGEMDPIDDRIKNNVESHGGCLFGYNTNMGQRIDLKLRTDDLKGFLPYKQIVHTLIHELSHNWIGDHDVLFWSNFGQMRVEYMYEHSKLSASGYVADGKSTSQVAEVTAECSDGLRSIAAAVAMECQQDMQQHGIPLSAVMPAITSKCTECASSYKKNNYGGTRLGGGKSADRGIDKARSTLSARERALEAAERRLKKQTEKERAKEKK